MIFPIQIPKVHDLGCNGKAFAIETYFDGRGNKAVFLSSYSQIVAAYEPSTTAVYWYPVPKAEAIRRRDTSRRSLTTSEGATSTSGSRRRRTGASKQEGGTHE